MPGYISPNDPRYNAQQQAQQGHYVSPNVPKQAQQPVPQMASRDVGSSVPGIGLLQSLLGREGSPNIPDSSGQVSLDELNMELEKARANNDVERVRNIRTMIQHREQDGQPLTSSDSATPTPQQAGAYPQGIIEALLGANPFGIVNKAQQDARDSVPGLLGK